MTIIVQSIGIPFGELNFRQRIYPEVHLLAKLFQNIESKKFCFPFATANDFMQLIALESFLTMNQ
jgi:hypothetical protein